MNREVKVFVKIKKKYIFLLGGVVSGRWGGLGGQDGCVQRIEVFCEN